MAQALSILSCFGVLMSLPTAVLAQDSALPPLVGLDGAPKEKEVVIGAAKVAAKPQVAIMDPQLGPGIAGKVGRRFLKRLTKALESTKRTGPVLQPTHLRAALPLEEQGRLMGCARKECVEALGQLIPVDVVVLISIRNVARAPLAIVRALAADGGELFVHRQALPAGQLKPDAAVVLANRVVSVLEKAAMAKTTLAAGPSGASASKESASVSASVSATGKTRRRWLRSVGFGIGLGGVGLIGTSYATLSSAQESFDAKPITRSTVDTLAAAEERSRILWGAGFALSGLSVVSLALGP